MSSILAFLGSVPAIITLIKELLAFLNKVTGNDPGGAVVRLGAAMAQLNQAKTPQEHSDAAKAIADSIARS